MAFCFGAGACAIIRGVMPINGKTADQLREEFYARLRESGEAQARFEEDMRRQWKKITGEWGRFTNDEGGMVEYEGVAALRELTEIGGMPIVGVSSALSAAKKRREYDGVIYCPKALVLLEFKRRLSRADVRKFIDEQLARFPLDFPDLLNGKTLYGAVAGAAVEDDAQALAEKRGLFTIRIPASRKVEILNARARPQKTAK